VATDAGRPASRPGLGPVCGRPDGGRSRGGDGGAVGHGVTSGVRWRPVPSSVAGPAERRLNRGEVVDLPAAGPTRAFQLVVSGVQSHVRPAWVTICSRSRGGAAA